MEALSAPWVHQELTQSLLKTQKRFFADQNDPNLRAACEELVQPLTGWWRDEQEPLNSMTAFRFLEKCCIAERVNALGIKKWREDIISLVERCPSAINHLGLVVFDDLFDTIRFNLATYEREYPKLRSVAFLLELALWKSKVDESVENGTVGVREQCRINCGADIIIPNVLPFLIFIEGGSTDSGKDDSVAESSNDDEEESGEEGNSSEEDEDE